MTDTVQQSDGLPEPLASMKDVDPSSPLYVVTSDTGVTLCGGCRAAGRCRMGLVAETLREDGVVFSELACPKKDEGGRKVAHGGWTAGVLDEIVGHTLLLRGEFAVTGTLTVVFRKPVPIEVPLIAESHVLRREGRRVFVSAEIKLAETGTVVASAEAVMVRRPADHFDRHDQWLAAELNAPTE
ncbi:PaaI family thioesterase [Mycobacterium sp. NBC_00419]|uniref:PaaI family thioesterase n=1 Tax=Mycobacterium sp. NBC_00419 TaxID=2975989 RepID=UPI002E24D6AF